MSDFGVTFVWCACQVALVGVMAATIHGVLRSYGRSIAPVISFAAIVVSIWLASTAFGPWPSYLDWIDMEPAAQAMRPDPETGGALAPSAELPFSTVFVDTVRTTVLEMAATDSRSLISMWPWSRVVSLLFVIGLCLGLAHLAIGMLVVQIRLRRSHPLRDRGLVRLVEQLRRDLGCKRPVQIRVAYDLATAATVGWSEPVILVPADWRTWTANERRAVLAHEMAHIVNNDYLAVLISQVGVALHFYHPFVHWMAGQLRLEQEFAADAIAAEHVGGRREYLKTLAMMALRKSNESQLFLARAFLPESGMLLKRISMLRERRRPTKPLSFRSQALLVASMLLAGLAISGLRQPANGAVWASPLLATPTLANVSGDNGTLNGSANNVAPATNESYRLISRPGAKNCLPRSNGECTSMRRDGNCGTERQFKNHSSDSFVSAGDDTSLEPDGKRIISLR